MNLVAVIILLVLIHSCIDYCFAQHGKVVPLHLEVRRQVKEDLSGLKVIAKVCPLPSPAPQIFCSVSLPVQEDGAFAEAVTKSKSKKERSQNKAVIDVADLFAGHFFGFFLRFCGFWVL